MLGKTAFWIPWCSIVLVVAVGCAETLLEPRYEESRQAWVLENRSGDVVQTLEFSHMRPAPGDTLRITSVVVNHGRARSIEARICGLDLATDLELRDPFGRCGGYSMKGTLAAGDTLHSSEMGVVESGPDVYRVRIRHLLDPERWIRVNIEVVQASTAR
jgi:hypothetical protein